MLGRELDVTAVPQTHTEVVYRRFARLAVHTMALLTRPRWRGMERVPDGGILVVSNHISNFDPLHLGHFLLSGVRRFPRFIGKSDIWRVPVLGWLARACDQIPVERHTSQAMGVVEVASERIARGQMVCMYPEGTITADPDTWPMTARSGAARIALRAGCPVIPIGQWGAQEVMPGKKLVFPRLWRRPKAQILVGEPVDLSGLEGRDDDDAVYEAGQRIMSAITALVSELRGEPAPATRWDMRVGRRLAPGERL